jgi:hypothetical protein
MRPSTVRFLTLAICGTAMLAEPVLAATQSQASSRQARHHQHDRTGHRLRNAFASEEFRPAAPIRNVRGEVCPSGRSFDCKIWPPPFDADPDRKSGDGGP